MPPTKVDISPMSTSPSGNNVPNTWCRRHAPLRSVENLAGSSPPSTCNATKTSAVTSDIFRNIHTYDIMQPLDRVDANCNNNSSNSNNKITRINPNPFADYYTVEGEIGRGKFASVKKCKHRRSGLQYAAKFLRKRRKGSDCRHDILHEVTMLEMALAHPHLVDLVEVFESSHEVIIVTEYAAGGELFQHVLMEERFDERHVVRLMRQILDGLVFLHDRDVVHLDIKPQNILLTNSMPHGNIKLCDFGFARYIHSGDDVRDIIGTPDYVAPEILSYEPIKTASDMWSVGVLAYVMLTGCSPFAGDNKQETFLNISQVNLDFPDDLFSGVSKCAIDFISKLLIQDPQKRMKAKECMVHPWVKVTEPSRIKGPEPRSPSESPTGQRRALSPPSPCLPDEPHKRYKCDATSRSRRDSASITTTSSATPNASLTVTEVTVVITAPELESTSCDSTQELTECCVTSVVATITEDVCRDNIQSCDTNNVQSRDEPNECAIDCPKVTLAQVADSTSSTLDSVAPNANSSSTQTSQTEQQGSAQGGKISDVILEQ